MNQPTPRVLWLAATVTDRRAAGRNGVPPVAVARTLLLAWVTGLAIAAAGCGSEPATSASGGAQGGQGGAHGGHGGAQGGHGGVPGGGGQGGSTTGGSGGTGGTTTTSSGGGGAGGEGGGGVVATPTCVEACQVAGDCAQAGQVYTGDHWECTGGKCKYLGCKTDQECLNTFGGVSDVCATDSGSAPYPLCVQSCQVADDCAQAGQVYTGEHWECAGGKCKYLGCKTDLECSNTFGGVSDVCATDSGSAPTPLCVKSCQVNADCAKAGQAFSEDNWECTGGRCKYLGCKTDLECSNTFGGVASVCL